MTVKTSKQKFKVTCKYCGKTRVWTFEPSPDFQTMDDIIEYDYEYSCESCGCSVRVYEALSAEDLEKLEYE